MYPSPLKGINSTVLSYTQTWMTTVMHSESSIKSNFCMKDIPRSPGLCFDEEKVPTVFNVVTKQAAAKTTNGLKEEQRD